MKQASEERPMGEHAINEKWLAPFLAIGNLFHVSSSYKQVNEINITALSRQIELQVIFSLFCVAIVYSGCLHETIMINFIEIR